jgi:AraC-like DNA-binding protein
MGVIATLLPNAEHLLRLRAAIDERHRVVACDDWSELVRVCQRQPVRLAVIDLFAGGRANFDQVRQIKQRLSRLTLVAYVSFSLDRLHDFFDAGRQGMDGLVIADLDDSPRALSSYIEHAESRALGSLVRRSLELEGVDATARDAFILAVMRAHEQLSPDVLAQLLALPRRTVSQRLATAGFPPPQRLLNWGRLIVAAHLMEDPRRSADGIAQSLGFPSGSAFRNICQRYVHATPREIRARGGARYVIRSMLRPIGAEQPHPPAIPGRRALALAV